ncbi:alpha-amylase [bacterium]|nr:alpha-amylase [bacterium]NBX98347.1 alpha-amylase [bacterium]NDC93749.1 alpha-amylase [bacterium]NDD82890.1 alpha-amylase [bacterium]NDG28685.1 alpha-amylase [bacterium]
MPKRAIVLYLHVHQPYRIRHYTIFDAGIDHNYFDTHEGDRTNNADIIRKVAYKSYIPTNERLLRMLHDNQEFKLSMSITGTVLEQFEQYAPEVLESFKQVIKTGRVEIVAETYHHSLAFFYSRSEFEAQVKKHADKIYELFGVVPTAFRNTELSYNNDIAYWADQAGYKAILSEGWDPVLGWRSPNFVYRPAYTNNIKLLTKNYKLSDDIAFRFSNRSWEEYPLTTEKYLQWLNSSWDQPLVNLFMDYETFGEHQWEDTGIFNFLEHLPHVWLGDTNHTFMTVSEAAESFEAVDQIDVPHTITWADTERDLTAWLGNKMQQGSIAALYALESAVLKSNDAELLEDWRKLQTSDHFYYMCTKWWSDGDVHAYFSPYESPYIAYENFMNAYHDIQYRLSIKGLLE